MRRNWWLQATNLPADAARANKPFTTIWSPCSRTFWDATPTPGAVLQRPPRRTRSYWRRLSSSIGCCHAIVALAETRWDSALKVTAELEARIELESLPAQRSTLAALRIDALLSRNAPGDAEYAERTLQAAGELSHLIFPWNICAEITYARTAVGSKRSNAARLLRKALDAAEERAHRLPFDADRAFAQIAVACRAAGNDAMATRATLRYSHYRKLRGAPSDSCAASSAAILGN